MSLHRFFLENQVISEETEASFMLDLSSDDARHARVLRLNPGEHIAVVDSSSDYFECEIVDVSNDGLMVRIADRGEDRPLLPKVALFQGLPKSDKLETVVRQGTELGVSSFVPFACSRSVVKLDEKKAAKRTERLSSIAKNAAMQAGREAVPEVSAPLSFKDALAALCGFDSIVVFFEEAEEGQTIKDALPYGLSADSRVAVVIGPEGGFDADEVDAMLSVSPNAKTATLGSNILRTETAGVLASALVIYELGGLGNISVK